MTFANRETAGAELAKELHYYLGQPDVIVFGLPRGGVVTAAAVAEALNTPLDIVVARKLSAPGNPELALGAVTDEGTPIFNKEVVQMTKASNEYVHNEIQKEWREAIRQVETYRQGRTALDLDKKTVILVDDGIATGATMLAAVASVRARGASKIIVAVPVTPPETMHVLARQVDEVVCLEAPEFFGAVGQFYQEFEQVSDEEVKKLLQEKNR